ncbi:MAG: tetratricopeptide repeat-containing protein, partial [Acidobacteriaceae bacterium]|nr:tetratricopeptide repeat-containing protein [Acidobacteriaceae bacterium]
NYKMAEPLFRKCLEIRRRVLGADHPESIVILSEFADMYQRQGQYALAETYAEEALSRQRRVAGSDKTDSLSGAIEALALAYESQGKFTQAESLAREALELNRKKQPNSWQRFRAESLLGASLAGQEKYAEAEPLLVDGYEGMIARKERISVPDRYHIDCARGWLAQVKRSGQSHVSGVSQ